MPKKIIYLFGAGATQAVIKDKDSDRSLMTSDIQKVIQDYTSIGIESRIWNELVTEGNDVEHLISVLETQYDYKASNKLRKYYHKALVQLATAFPSFKSANLYSVLVDLHTNVPDLDEELICMMTLNYEDILEKSIKNHLKYDIDYFIETDHQVTNPKKVKVLKLHGSFNWGNNRPISIQNMSILSKKDNALWIPPGVGKRIENYPFNLIWGKAKELLLNCDIIRIVGCSLSRNDWALIPILYIVQKFNNNNKTDIEIIDYLNIANNIENNYRYLKIKKIVDIDVLQSYFKRKFPSSSQEEMTREMNNHFSDKDKTNAFQVWLDAKIEDVIEKNIDISRSLYLKNFYYKN